MSPTDENLAIFSASLIKAKPEKKNDRFHKESAHCLSWLLTTFQRHDKYQGD